MDPIRADFSLTRLPLESRGVRETRQMPSTMIADGRGPDSRKEAPRTVLLRGALHLDPQELIPLLWSCLT